MNLYELSDNFLIISKMLGEDIDNQILIDTLDSLEASIEVKAQNIVYVDKNLEVYSKGLSAEIERLEKKRDAIENKRNVLKDNLFKNLELVGRTELKTNISTIKKQSNPPSVLITDESLIPAKFQTVVPQTYKISKSEIAKELKAGVEVPGAKLTQSQRWVIK